MLGFFDILEGLFTLVGAGYVGVHAVASKQDNKTVDVYEPMKRFERLAHYHVAEARIDEELREMSLEDIVNQAADVMSEVCFPPMLGYPLETATRINGVVLNCGGVKDRVKEIMTVQCGYLPTSYKFGTRYNVHNNTQPYHLGWQVNDDEMNLMRWIYWELRKHEYDLDDMDEWFLYRGVDPFGVCGRNIIRCMQKQGNAPGDVDVRDASMSDEVLPGAIVAVRNILAIASYRVKKIKEVLKSGVFGEQTAAADVYAHALRCIDDAEMMLPGMRIENVQSRVAKKKLILMDMTVRNTMQNHNDIIARREKDFYIYKSETGQLMSDADEVLYSIREAKDLPKLYSPSLEVWWKPLRDKIREIARAIGCGGGWRRVYKYW